MSVKECKIRGTENLHILLWIFKDTAWVNDWHILGVSMIAPTLAVAVWLTYRTCEHRTEFIHNLAVCWWLCANSVWMIGEFFYEDHTRGLAMIFFALGLITLAYHYLPQLLGWLKTFWSDWYECPLCGHKVKLHKSDFPFGCVKDGCLNIEMPLRRCVPPED